MWKWPKVTDHDPEPKINLFHRVFKFLGSIFNSRNPFMSSTSPEERLGSSNEEPEVQAADDAGFQFRAATELKW